MAHRWSVPPRPELCAALAFVEGAIGWSERDLVSWFEVHLAGRGTMAVPSSIREPPGPLVPLDPLGTSAPLTDLLRRARARVVGTLRGLVAEPTTDAFLNGAIFAGRVRRVTQGGTSSWRPTPQPTDGLSDVVLSLFVTDILSHRDLYDCDLMVCRVCGRIAFEPNARVRTACHEHPPACAFEDDSRDTLPAID